MDFSTPARCFDLLGLSEKEIRKQIIGDQKIITENLEGLGSYLSFEHQDDKVRGQFRFFSLDSTCNEILIIAPKTLKKAYTDFMNKRFKNNKNGTWTSDDNTVKVSISKIGKELMMISLLRISKT